MTDYKKLANPDIYRHILLEEDNEGSFASLEQREDEVSPFFLPDRVTLSVPVRRQQESQTKCKTQKIAYAMEPILPGRNKLETPLAPPPNIFANETQTKREGNDKCTDSLHQSSINDGIELNEDFCGGRISNTSNFSGEWMCRLIPQQDKKVKPRYKDGEDSQKLIQGPTAENSKSASCFSVKRLGKSSTNEMTASLSRRPWEVDQWHTQRMQQIDFETAQMGLPKGSWTADHQRRRIRETSNSSRRSVRTPATSTSSQSPLFEAFKEPVSFSFEKQSSTEQSKPSLQNMTNLFGQMALRETSWEAELSDNGPRVCNVSASVRAKEKHAAIPRVIFVESEQPQAKTTKSKAVTNSPGRIHINLKNVHLRPCKPPMNVVTVQTSPDHDDISLITNPNFACKANESKSGSGSIVIRGDAENARN